MEDWKKNSNYGNQSVQLLIKPPVNGYVAVVSAQLSNPHTDKCVITVALMSAMNTSLTESRTLHPYNMTIKTFNNACVLFFF